MTATHFSPRICVIGAGPSGITAVKNLLQVGLTNVVCYEKNNRIGGNWVYSENASHSSVFHTTHIISSKILSQYLDFPMPDHYPHYPSHSQLLAYFESYAQRFGVLDYVRFQTEVLKAERNIQGKWVVRVSDGSTEIFDYLLVANGHHWSPRMPQYRGQFAGRLLHSHDFKHNKPFKDERVLVIGGGNSACDCAVETSRVSAFTGLSMRRGYYIVPKFMFGQPTDIINARLTKLPRRLRQWLGQAAYRLNVGDLRNYGLQRPKHWAFEAHPTMNSELLYMIGHGKVHPRPDIERFEGNTVHFVDGSAETYDTIIACTGFDIVFPFFDPQFINYRNTDVPLYLRVFHPDYRNLCFIGLVQPQGCIWPLSDAQSRLVAQYIAGNYRLPTDLREQAFADARRIKKSYTPSHRHTVEVDYHEHLHELLAACQGQSA
jgi:hypothetical protein